MNFEPAHPRETILDALELLDRWVSNQTDDPNSRTEALDLIVKAKQWAHRATTPEERDAPPTQ